MARPGVMIYFDMLGPFKVLPKEEAGELIIAILEYGQSGKVPQFNGMLAMAWEFIKPKLDRDGDEYDRTVLKRQYATFCRDRKKKGEPEISFEEWMMTIDNHVISHDIKWYPTTTTTPTTTTPTTIATAVAATTNITEPEDTAATADRKVDVLGGNLGKGVVFLSEAQFSDLLDKMGLETFDYYVDKLSTFIIQNNAHVKNHYETILKWWREDGAVHGSME